MGDKPHLHWEEQCDLKPTPFLLVTMTLPRKGLPTEKVENIENQPLAAS